jgi:hypothetical protein
VQYKKCPCGQIPDHLIIVDGECAKWAYVSGSCCNEWKVEFRTQYFALDSDECLKLATEAWQEAPRG